MGINIFKPFTNNITGETFRTISYNHQAFVMQLNVKPSGYVPFEHIHLHQDEVFEVRKGVMRILLDGSEWIVKAGETIVVPKGIPHVAYNDHSEELECVVSYIPGLDHYRLMQCLKGLTTDGYLDKKGSVNIPMMGYFLVKMKVKCLARPTAIPAPVFKIALCLFYIRGVLSGWSKLLEKYTSGPDPIDG